MRVRLTVRDIAFVLRCSGTATLAYALASGLGLEHPVWASISGVIVSQEKLDETRNAVHWRVAGTLVGIVVAVIAGSLIDPLGWSVAVQTGISVAICASLVRCWPDLKVAMWTAPVLFFARDPGMSLFLAGVWRGAEVLLGGLTGALLHMIFERIIRRLERSWPSEPTDRSKP